MEMISNALRMDVSHLKLNHRMVNMLAATTSSTILTGQHLRNISNLIRTVECLVFLAMVSRFSLNFPLALTLLRDFIGDVAVTVVSPRFGFFLGNAVVLILLLKTSSSSSSDHRIVHKQNPKQNHVAAVSKHLPSQSKIETGKLSSLRGSPVLLSPGSIGNAVAAVPTSPSKEEFITKKCTSTTYRRINSEKVLVKRGRSLLSEEERKGEQQKLVLRRSKTETRLAGVRDQVHEVYGCKTAGRGKEETKKVDQQQYPEDRMSSDEFRRTIDDFIAWKQKYLREEDEKDEDI